MISMEKTRGSEQPAEGLPFTVYGLWVDSDAVPAVVLPGHLVAVDDDEGPFRRWSKYVWAATAVDAEAKAVAEAEEEA